MTVLDAREQRRAIRQVLEKLLDGGEKWQQESLGEDGPGIANPLKPMNKSKLSDRLNQWRTKRHLRKRHRGEFMSDEVIRVEPPGHDVIMAALRCKWDLDADATWCSFYLGIWLQDGRFIGFRFEPPEVGDNHNYYHSQPCLTMGDGKPIVQALKVPERNPTLPLPAKSSLDLLLCLVLSIHGMAGLKKMKADFDRDPLRYHALICAIEKVIALAHKSTA